MLFDKIMHFSQELLLFVGLFFDLFFFVSVSSVYVLVCFIRVTENSLSLCHSGLFDSIKKRDLDFGSLNLSTEKKLTQGLL